MAKSAIRTILERFDIEGAVDSGTLDGLEAVGILLTNEAKTKQIADTGRLRNSIMYKVSNGNQGGFNQGGNTKASSDEKLQGTPSGKSVVVGSNVEYAVYEEFGTSRRGAKPYLRPAIEIVVNGTDSKKAMAKALNESVNKAKIKSRKGTVE